MLHVAVWHGAAVQDTAIYVDFGLSSDLRGAGMYCEPRVIERLNSASLPGACCPSESRNSRLESPLLGAKWTRTRAARTSIFVWNQPILAPDAQVGFPTTTDVGTSVLYAC